MSGTDYERPYLESTGLFKATIGDNRLQEQSFVTVFLRATAAHYLA